jgi:hypothetical protein
MNTIEPGANRTFHRVPKTRPDVQASEKVLSEGATRCQHSQSGRSQLLDGATAMEFGRCAMEFGR